MATGLSPSGLVAKRAQPVYTVRVYTDLSIRQTTLLYRASPLVIRLSSLWIWDCPRPFTGPVTHRPLGGNGITIPAATDDLYRPLSPPGLRRLH